MFLLLQYQLSRLLPVLPCSLWFVCVISSPGPRSEPESSSSSPSSRRSRIVVDSPRTTHTPPRENHVWRGTRNSTRIDVVVRVRKKTPQKRKEKRARERDSSGGCNCTNNKRGKDLLVTHTQREGRESAAQQKTRSETTCRRCRCPPTPQHPTGKRFRFSVFPFRI